MNQELVVQALEAQLSNSRQVLAHTKGRGEVRGGGKKPWRQKGTGRARHASIRSPIWKGGGVAFGPTKDRNFKKKINKKMKRQALFMALSSKVRDGEFLLVDDFKMEGYKTKEANKIFDSMTKALAGYRKNKKKQDSIVLIAPGQNKEAVRAVRNLPYIEIKQADSLNIKEMLENKYLVLLKDSIPVIEKTYKI